MFLCRSLWFLCCRELVLLGLLYFVQSQQIGWEDRLQNDLFCVKCSVSILAVMLCQEGFIGFNWPGGVTGGAAIFLCSLRFCFGDPLRPPVMY